MRKKYVMRWYASGALPIWLLVRLSVLFCRCVRAWREDFCVDEFFKALFMWFYTALSTRFERIFATIRMMNIEPVSLRSLKERMAARQALKTGSA